MSENNNFSVFTNPSQNFDVFEIELEKVISYYKIPYTEIDECLKHSFNSKICFCYLDNNSIRDIVFFEKLKVLQTQTTVIFLLESYSTELMSFLIANDFKEFVKADSIDLLIKLIDKNLLKNSHSSPHFDSKIALDSVLNRQQSAYFFVNQEFEIEYYNLFAIELGKILIEPSLSKYEIGLGIFKYFESFNTPELKSIIAKIETGYVSDYPISVINVLGHKETYILNVSKQISGTKGGYLISICLKNEFHAAQSELKQIKLNLDTVFKNSTTGYIFLNQELRILSFNQSAIDIANKNHENQHKSYRVNEHILEYFPKNRHNILLENFNSALNGNKVSYEVPYLRLNGEIDWYQVSLDAINPNSDNIKGLVMAITEITQRKNSEIEYIKLKSNFETILNTSESGYVLINKNYQIVSFNTTADQIRKRHHNDVKDQYQLNTNILEYFPENKQLVFKEKLDNINELRSFRFEISNLDANGELKYYVIGINAINLSEIGSDSDILISIYDITKQKSIEFKILESENNLKTILNSSDNAYLIIDLDFNIIEFNILAIDFMKSRNMDNFEDLSKGESVFNFILEDSKSQILNYLQKVISTQNGIEYQIQNFKNGKESHHTVKLFPIFDINNKIYRIGISASDITKYKESQESLIKSQAYINSIFENTDIGYILLDSQTRHLSHNKIIKKYIDSLNIYLNISAFWNFVPLLEILDTERKIWLEKTIKKLISSEIVEQEFETSYQNISIWLLIKFIPIFNIKGELTNIMIAVSDISESKNFQKQILDAKENLEKAQELASIGSWKFNMENYELEWSKELYKIFDIKDTKPSALFEKYKDRLHPEDRGKLENLIALKKDYNIEHRIILDDGSIKYIFGKGKFSKNLKGEINGLRGIAQDITIQKQKDLELFQNQELLLYKSQLLAATAEITKELLFTKDLNKSLQISIKKVGQAFKTRGAYLFECKGTEYTIFKAFNWVSPEINRIVSTEELIGYSLAEFEDIIKPINRKKAFVFYTNEIKNPTSKKFLINNEIESVFVLPIFVKDIFFGLIGFIDIHEMRSWSSDEITILNSMVTNISSAIEKINYQKKIEESEVNFRQITETINDVFWLYDAIENKYIYISPNCENILFTKQSYFYEIGHFVDDFLDEDSQQIFKDFRKKIEEEGTFYAEYKICSEKGEFHWIQEKSFAIRDESGRVIRISGISVDKTESFKINSDLKQLSQVAQNISNGVLVRNINGEITFANKAYLDIFELNSLQEIGTKASHFNYLNESNSNEMFNDEKQFTTEIVTVSNSGKIKNLTVYNNPIFDDKGALIEQITIINDISEKVKANKQTEKIAKRLGLILNSLDEVVFAVSLPDQKPIFMSQSFEKFTGFKTQDWFDNPRIWQQLLRVEDRQSVKSIFNEFLEKDAITGTFKILDLDQNERWVDFGIKRIYNEKNIPYMLLGTAQNITEQVLAQKQVLNSIKAAEVANRSINELELKTLQLQMNPHFIFNALNSIQSYVMHQDHFLANAYLSKFAKLIRLFLDSSRSRYITLKDEIVLLTLYMELEKLRFEDKFEFEIVCDPNISTYIEIPTMILQPFVENAINHGLRYKESKGWMKVEFYTENDILYCSIQDNGVGREKAKTIQKNTQKGYQSQGLKITMERLITYNKINNSDLQFIIKDLIASNGDENLDTGTEMIITFSGL